MKRTCSALLLSVLCLAVVVPMASAQTTHCSTTPSYLGSTSYDTTCSTSPSYISPYSDALAQLYVLEAEEAYLQSLANAAPPAGSGMGITINMDSGGQQYLARGTFVKIGDAPAIYWVYGGQLHAFSTWPQFLSAGGNPDLSNVVYFTTLRDGGGLFGAPVR